MNTQVNTTEELWKSFSIQLKAFLHKRLPSSADVDDVLQDLFIKIHTSLPKLRDTDNPGSWLYTIARNTIADYYRKQYRYIKLLHAYEESFEKEEIVDPRQASEKLSSDVAAIHQEVLSWLQPMINNLPLKYKEALVMADIQGLPQHEVAKHLGLSVPGAKSRIQRARKQLAEILTTCCELEFGAEGTVINYEAIGTCPPNVSCDPC